ncbi:UDP-galactopyranose mutase [Rhizobium sp. 007]|nr:UDP-galactopyranose mutase [Rhizobium sp. 007]
MNLSSSFTQGLHKALQRKAPIICFSHLRWDFVLQRPQHLMERFARDRQVFYFEEFIPTDHHLAYLEIHPFEGTAVKAIRPRIPHWLGEDERERELRKLLDELLSIYGVARPILWFYTPLMYGFARHIDAAAVIYDCMDELANFKFAPPTLKDAEAALLARADVAFTGGYSLYEAKRHLHDNIHPFPSSVDADHFHAARGNLEEPADQRSISSPKLGYYGVIDERLDLGLISAVANARPDLSFVFIGPIVKISPDDLPKAANIHYLGRKAYGELPAYVSGWNVALMPFALNDATRLISPTKTPEYLAAGRPIVSTPVADVVRQYGGVSGVALARDAEGFATACDDALALKEFDSAWLRSVDILLAASSWDDTFDAMNVLVEEAIIRRSASPHSPTQFPCSQSSVRSRPSYDYLIVGAGFAGSVMAERLASDGKHVLLCDKRLHIGGNAYDFHNEDGILVHRYGPHIFHTNSLEIFDYLSQFTAWRPYQHRVLADIGDRRLPVPINRTTLNGLYCLNLKDDAEAALFLAARAEPCDPIETAKDAVVSQVGDDLYRTFFQGYSRKQWGLDPTQLDRSVTSRVPARVSDDDRYFLDTYQAMPLHGYTEMFEKMLDHECITVLLGTEFADIRKDNLAAHTIFTGPIDEYFDFRFGRLPYRSLEFRHETHDARRLLPVGVINYPSETVPYTRITEYKHLTGQIHPKTTISYEFAGREGEPYYPIPRPENQELYKQYEAVARRCSDVTFVGRLATYKYYNMDQVVGQALATYRKMSKARASTIAASVK